MIATHTLNLARSEFNHAWLKNRLILALNRAMRGLQGRIQDETIWGDLSALLADWPSRRADALRLLEKYSTSESPPKELVRRVLPEAPPEIGRWLAMVVELRGGMAEARRAKVLTARQALDELDTEVQRFSALAVGCAAGGAPPSATEVVRDLRAAADRLAHAFSRLGVLSGGT